MVISQRPVTVPGKDVPLQDVACLSDQGETGVPATASTANRDAAEDREAAHGDTG